MLPLKKFPQNLLGLFALCAVFGAGLRAQDVQPSSSHEKALLPSARRAVIHTTAGPSTTIPVWNNGYLVSWDTETFQAGAQNVRLYEGSGNQAVVASIWFPEAVRVLLYSATATSDGRIIAGGSEEKVDGTYVPFIAKTDAAGNVTSVLQPPGFGGPMNVCQALDGTVWSFGGTGFDEHTHLPNPGNTLRHYDFQKGEVGSYLARSLFPRRGPETHAGMRCSADEVVAYSFNSHMYIEMKYSGEAPEVYHTEEPVGHRFVGFAATGPKKIYGYFWNSDKGGLYSLAFNETAKTAQWVPVTGAVGDLNTPGVITYLWGSEGDKLVVSRAEDPLGASAFHWVAVTDR